jgi:hypothetical protein
MSYNKNYYEKNKKRIQARHKKWRLKNKEYIKIKSKQYRDQNKEKCSLAQKEWRLKNLKHCQQYYEKNKERRKKYIKQWRLENKKSVAEKMWAWRIQKQYNITPENYFKIEKQQNFKCAICKTDKPPSKLYIDHNHKTNNVRGLLCLYCNTLLGYAKENTTILENAIRYLNE